MDSASRKRAPAYGRPFLPTVLEHFLRRIVSDFRKISVFRETKAYSNRGTIPFFPDPLECFAWLALKRPWMPCPEPPSVAFYLARIVEIFDRERAFDICCCVLQDDAKLKAATAAA